MQCAIDQAQQALAIAMDERQRLIKCLPSDDEEDMEVGGDTHKRIIESEDDDQVTGHVSKVLDSVSHVTELANMCFVHVLYMMYAQVPPLLELCSQLSTPACISALVKSILLLLLCILKISGNHYFMKSAWDGVQCSAVQ